MNMRVLVITVLSLMAMVSVEAGESCPRFWVLFRGNCYRYFGDRLTWAKAESSCNDYSTTTEIARLVSIHDDDENTFVYKLFRHNAGDTPDYVNAATIHGVWIGLHLLEADWINTDGSAGDYFNWLPSYPNGGSNEPCAHIWRRNDGDDTVQKWNDYNCDRLMQYVCKMPATK